METTEAKLHQLSRGCILNGKYRIERVLGEGGFGITYLATDTSLDLLVAIKEYYPAGYVTREVEFSNTVTSFTGEKQEIYEEGRRKFIKEAQTLGKLSGQSGIVAVRDYFQENNTAYIIMEYLDGITLKEYLRQAGGRLAAADTIALVRPVVRALIEVHRHGMIHRDISPDNIMVLPGNQLKLLDFGAARDVSINGEKSLSVMLKPGYAPEEQYRTRGEQGPWSDIYALCATVYRCVTGQVPLEAMERMRSDTLQPPSALGCAISPQYEQALMQGLAVFKEQRLQSAEQLYALWYGDPVTAAQYPQTGMPQYTQTGMPQYTQGGMPQPQNGKPRKKLPFVIGGIAAAVVLIVAVCGVGIMLLPEKKQTPQQVPAVAAQDTQQESETTEALELPAVTQIRASGLFPYEDGLLYASLKELSWGQIPDRGAMSWNLLCEQEEYIETVCAQDGIAYFAGAGGLRSGNMETGGTLTVLDSGDISCMQLNNGMLYYMKELGNSQYELWRINTDGSGKEKLVDAGKKTFDIMDGTVIVYCKSYDQINMLDLASGDEAAVTQEQLEEKTGQKLEWMQWLGCVGHTVYIVYERVIVCMDLDQGTYGVIPDAHPQDNADGYYVESQLFGNLLVMSKEPYGGDSDEACTYIDIYDTSQKKLTDAIVLNTEYVYEFTYLDGVYYIMGSFDGSSKCVCYDPVSGDFTDMGGT